ncbi:MAG TPA: PEP/pyruvate-binding domain-containing protein [Candidatus Lokiarchaeia archaeon]|nr:PEP/pyruvate-binding domain-containing protein [Candidatus Lokiarchaeia archaeon]
MAYLYHKKFPVPEGLALFPNAFVGDDLQAGAKDMLFSNLEKIRAHQKSPVDFAVRSSALSEDSAKASFAGEFETVLNVRTNDDIIAAVQKVRQSRHSERVENYSEVKGMATDHEMAVVVQVMIPAEVSGVLFTAEPVTGDTAKITGNYVKGLGERIVSGDSNGEAFAILRPKMHYMGPPDMKKPALELAKIAVKIEKDRLCPQDIEWAMAQGKIYILQARPITTMSGFDIETGILNESFTGNYVWTASNAGEAVGDVLTPLSATFLKYAMKLEKMLPNIETIGLVGNRAFFNLSLLYSLVKALGQPDSMVVELLGELPPIQIPILPLGRWKLIWMLLPVFVKVSRKQANGRKYGAKYIAENPRRVQEYIKKINSIANLEDLKKLWFKDIEKYFWDGSYAMLAGSDPAAHASTKLKKQL